MNIVFETHTLKAVNERKVKPKHHQHPPFKIIRVPNNREGSISDSIIQGIDIQHRLPNTGKSNQNIFNILLSKSSKFQTTGKVQSATLFFKGLIFNIAFQTPANQTKTPPTPSFQNDQSSDKVQSATLFFKGLMFNIALYHASGPRTYNFPWVDFPNATRCARNQSTRS